MRWRLRFLTDRPRPLHGSSALPGYGLGKPEYPTKPFSGANEAGPKPRSAIRRPDSKTGCVKMMEAVTVILGLFCVGIFVAHAVDAYLMP
jgi:hypothetical protein